MLNVITSVRDKYKRIILDADWKRADALIRIHVNRIALKRATDYEPVACFISPLFVRTPQPSSLRLTCNFSTFQNCNFPIFAASCDTWNDAIAFMYLIEESIMSVLTRRSEQSLNV